MNWDWLPWRPKAPAPVTRQPRASSGTSGRPTYGTFSGSLATVPRELRFDLLRQFRANIPVLKRTCEIYAGFVGVPTLKIEGNDPASDDLKQWADNVEYGSGVGRGLRLWTADLIDQALTYGFSVGEAVADGRRSTISRLWTYDSRSIQFKSDAAGEVTLVQSGVGGDRTLNPATVARLTHGPKGCNPNGESLFYSLPSFCTALLDIHHANRATWRRNGIPTFHVNWEPHDSFDDPEGTLSAAVRGEMETAFNEAIRSQVVDGVAKDFFSTGKTTITVIGADGMPLDIEISNRVLMEQIISATGIPPMLFGLSWSTTERMSKQQADMFLTSIDCIRYEIEAAIRFVIDLRQRLTGNAALLAYTLTWPDVSLQDLLDTAKADLATAQATESRERVGKKLWAAGVYDQAKYAEFVTGSDEVVTEMDEPPAEVVTEPPVTAPVEPPDPATENLFGEERLTKGEWEATRQELIAVGAGCNGRH